MGMGMARGVVMLPPPFGMPPPHWPPPGPGMHTPQYGMIMPVGAQYGGFPQYGAPPQYNRFPPPARYSAPPEMAKPGYTIRMQDSSNLPPARDHGRPHGGSSNGSASGGSGAPWKLRVEPPQVLEVPHGAPGTFR